MPRPCTMPPAMALLLCLAVLSSGGGCEGCRDDERATLLDIRGQFNYNSSLDWNSTATDCCRWEGVSCSSRTARVTGLDLSMLHGIASSTGLLNTTMFLPLQELQDLSLSGLKIQGCTPGAGFEVWSKLHRLKVLDLSYNGKLMESDVPSLVAISSLRSLFLNGNDFSSNMTIQKLSIMKVDTLDIGKNDIKGTIPTDICNMRDLQVLYLSDNLLFGEIPSCMQNLTSLRILGLSENNRLIVKFPSLIFAKLTSLEKLSLVNNSLEGVLSLSSLQNHRQLTKLELASSGNNFHVQTENPATNLPAQIQVLVLRNCNLNGNSGIIPSFLLHQHKLEFVDMSNNNLSGNFPSWLIENNVNLSHLVLGSNSFAGPLLPSKVHTGLQWLDASSNRLSILPVDINTTLPNLSYISLSGNSYKGNFPSSFSYMNSLQYLELSYNNFLDDIAAAFVGNMLNIIGLKLSGNHFYGSFSPNILLPAVKHLLLSDNEIAGKIPEKLCDSLILMTFDASNNKLTGLLPTCISALSELAILNLRENSLAGSIPSEVCGL
ncbi:unnamed protein product [Triticum turgidum subsp. durum]|uniref:Leucine-rich repeat-containing N-terminal plant-type domain-containing protein n=1 Tax=Triticum turgidum subsp. durum TaxID=4567 RepID=A0A9R0Z4G7_TRITD|nr:unnamed protein product [Triticum turgidum subsp. durum]